MLNPSRILQWGKIALLDLEFAYWKQAKNIRLETRSSIWVLALAAAFASETPLKAVPSQLEGSNAHAEGFSQAAQWARGPCTGSHSWRVQSQHTRQEKGRAQHVCVWLPPPIQFVPFPGCAGWRGRLPLGTMGTATALKSWLKVTVSPPAWFPQGVKWYTTRADYFHLLGLWGAGGLYVLFTSPSTGGKPSGRRSSPWVEKLHWVIACFQTALCPFSHRLFFLPEFFFLSENVVSSESSICWEARGTWPSWQMFFNIPGRWNEAKRKLASTWALAQNKVI